MRGLRVVLIALLGAACKQDAIETRRVAKEDAAPASAAAPAESALPDAGSRGVEAPPRASGLRWTAPSDWKELPGDGMRVATFEPPQAAGKVEGTVVALPGDAGGELANVNRWRGQVALPPVQDVQLGALRKVVRCPAGEVSVYDFTSQDTVKTRLIAGMIKVDGTLWFFKLTGAEKAVEQARPAFTSMLGRLSRDG